MRVFIIEDHPLVREGVRTVLEKEEDIEIAGMAGSGEEAEQIFSRVQPDIALVDLRLPGEYGLDIINKLKLIVPGCQFIVLTSFAAPNDIKSALDTGVEGYILKEALPEELVSAIRLVKRGRFYYDPVIMQTIIKEPQKQSNYLSELTEREKEVLSALAQGLSNKDIALMLCVTENTVKKHISNIFSKLDINDRTQAALFAVAHGMTGFRGNIDNAV